MAAYCSAIGLWKCIGWLKHNNKTYVIFQGEILVFKILKKIANNDLTKIRPTYDMVTAILSFNLLVLIEGLAEIINLCNFLCVLNGVLTSSATR